MFHVSLDSIKLAHLELKRVISIWISRNCFESNIFIVENKIASNLRYLIILILEEIYFWNYAVDFREVFFGKGFKIHSHYSFSDGKSRQCFLYTFVSSYLFLRIIYFCISKISLEFCWADVIDFALIVIICKDYVCCIFFISKNTMTKLEC